jgi:hypothetical protein
MTTKLMSKRFKDWKPLKALLKEFNSDLGTVLEMAIKYY